MSGWRFWRKSENHSVEVKRMEELVKESETRLNEAKVLSGRAEKVIQRLNDKNRRNGWGEIIAETMRRAER